MAWTCGSAKTSLKSFTGAQGMPASSRTFSQSPLFRFVKIAWRISANSRWFLARSS